MNVNFQFSDVIGSVYKNGNVQFLADGNTLLSPIGNKLKTFLLKDNLTKTLLFESTSNITYVSANKVGTHAIVLNEEGECMYVSFVNGILLHTAHIGNKMKIRCLEISPDGKTVAICTRGHVRFYSIADFSRMQFHPLAFAGQRRLSAEPMNCVNWSADGRLLVCGGEDRIVRVFSRRRAEFANVSCFNMSQGSPIVGVHFLKADGYDIVTANKSGIACVYTCSLTPNELIPVNEDELEGEIVLREPLLRYERTQRAKLAEKVSPGDQLTKMALNQNADIFVAGFDSGVFLICQLPEFLILQSFRAGEQQISSLDVSPSGSWLAVGCGRGSEAQLIVWEWESETYIMKQQSHLERITSAAYSPDGSTLCTGAEDGKVKLWNCLNSFCIVTFTEHNAGVTDVCFTQSGKVILSASMEGTVRAHDLKRYRNFRTMVAPKQTQLNRLCTDASGDLVMASSRDLFEIYLWSMETGNVLNVFTGHTDLVLSISCHNLTMASTSMDRTLRLWNVTSTDGASETVDLFHEGLDVAYSPCGHVLAVLCYDSCISLFNTLTNSEIGSIETKLDIDAARESQDKVKKSTSEKNKSFTCIAFSPDSVFLLAGGQSNTFCLYSVQHRVLLRTFKVTANISLDGVLLDIDYRKYTDFGNINLFEVSDSDEEEEQRRVNRKLKLPGTRHSDKAERSARPSMRISQMMFNPTGRSFAVVSTEGVFTYALDVKQRFDPYQLETEVTPQEVRTLFNQHDYVRAVSMALRLNDSELIRSVIEELPYDQLKSIVEGLQLIYAEKLLKWIGAREVLVLMSHIHLYQALIQNLLYFYGAELKKNLQPNLPAIISIQQHLNAQSNLLAKLCQENKYSIKYLLMARNLNGISVDTK